MNKKGLVLLKESEGCKLSAYVDPGTGGEPITIGYGSTYYEDGKKVKMGDKITQERAEFLLLQIMEPFENCVRKAVITVITDNQLAALTVFAYNVGQGNFLSSTLLKKININPNDTAITKEFSKWNKGGGKVLPGLVIRRKKESDLYFS